MTIGNQRSCRMHKKTISQEKIIKTTLEMVQRKNGIRDINLRKFARELGCAHTNLYNYFPNFNELMWNAMFKATELMGEFIFERQTLESLIDRYIVYAYNNRELYKLIWYEDLGEVPDNLKDRISSPGRKTIRMLEKTTAFSEEALEKRVNNAMSYVHGEISFLLFGRRPGGIPDFNLWKKRVKRTALSIFYDIE